MQLIASHLVLVSAPSLENAVTQVRDFFDHTLLIRYDRIDIQEKSCLSATEKGFEAALRKGLETNTATLGKFIDEFEKTGFKTINDLSRVECGYPSKLLHIITHFLDGFIGIDSRFYNLIDDSHWLNENTRRAIIGSPRHYWLIQLEGHSETPDMVSLVQV